MACNSSSSKTEASLLKDREEGLHLPSCTREPSKCNCQWVSWIWASNPNRSTGVDRIGKWMLFPSSKYVDETWNKVKTQLAAGKLGSIAKVAPASFSNNGRAHLICIYTDDHEDVADVMRVLTNIRQSRLSIAALHYKTDDATLSGVYSNDPSSGVPIKKKHRNEKVSKYTSPKVETSGTDRLKAIKLLLNNIGPQFEQGLVAELNLPTGQQPQSGQKRKMEEASSSSDPSGQFVTIIHNPPQILTAAKKAKKSN